MITIGQFLVPRSAMILSLVQIRSHTFGQDLSRSSLQCGACQSDTIITIGVPNLGRCGTRIYVLMRLSGTNTLSCDRYDCGPDIFHDHEQG